MKYDFSIIQLYIKIIGATECYTGNGEGNLSVWFGNTIVYIFDYNNNFFGRACFEYDMGGIDLSARFRLDQKEYRGIPCLNVLQM